MKTLRKYNSIIENLPHFSFLNYALFCFSYIAICKMFAHPYQSNELVCKKFKVVLISMDDDTIENSNKSISSLFIDEIIGCEQWTPCSRWKINSLFLKSDETIQHANKPPIWGSVFQAHRLITPTSRANCVSHVTIKIIIIKHNNE